MSHCFFTPEHCKFESLKPPFEFDVTGSKDVYHFNAALTQAAVEDFSVDASKKNQTVDDNDIFKDFDFCSDAMKQEIINAHKQSNKNDAFYEFIQSTAF